MVDIGKILPTSDGVMLSMVWILCCVLLSTILGDQSRVKKVIIIVHSVDALMFVMDMTMKSTSSLDCQ